MIKRKKYILKPNVGLNYRFYKWIGEMSEPYDVLPQRGYRIEMRKGSLLLNSFDGKQKGEYRDDNIGFSIQIQNQFQLTDQLWLHITPFLEPDYDGIHTNGGCYIGVLFKKKEK